MLAFWRPSNACASDRQQRYSDAPPCLWRQAVAGGIIWFQMKYFPAVVRITPPGHLTISNPRGRESDFCNASPSPLISFGNIADAVEAAVTKINFIDKSLTSWREARADERSEPNSYVEHQQ